MSALKEKSNFNITGITRADSSTALPEGIAVKKIDYDSHESLVAALKGQDVLIITLAISAPQDIEHKLIDAAAAAGVSWVLPNEFGSDNSKPTMHAPVLLFGGKTRYLEQVEKLGKSSWIGVVNNPWYEYSLGGGLFGIDIKNRVARLWDDGNTKTNTTTFAQVGRGLAGLLSLPVSTTDSSPSLSDFKNKYVYISSFLTTQNEILASVQRVTGTSPSDWQVSYSPVEEAKKTGKEKFVKEGDFLGMIGYMYGTYFSKGLGGNYQEKRDNRVLGLHDEDLDEATNRTVEMTMAK